MSTAEYLGFIAFGLFALGVTARTPESQNAIYMLCILVTGAAVALAVVEAL